MTSFSAEALRDKRATVMGLGLFGGGVSATRFLVARGARVTVTDLRNESVLSPAIEALVDLDVRFVLGRHRPDDFSNTDLVVANPAVPPSSPFLEQARSRGVRVTSEVALFLETSRARVCAVTGTQGKSSTSNLLAHLLRSWPGRVFLGGNIGGSLLEETPDYDEQDLVVLELSSYQLEALGLEEQLSESARRLEAAAILNVLEDHLERHGSREAYAAAKAGLLDFVRPGGFVFLPDDDPIVRNWKRSGLETIHFSTETTRASLRLNSGEFCLGQEVLAKESDLRLAGSFQRTNALVALGMARTLGVAVPDLAPALRDCTGLPYRLEDLGVLNGCRVWDNAVSTTPDSTVAAMNSLAPGFTLLLGGQVKNLPLDKLANAASTRARHVICFGSGANRFARDLDAHGVPFEVVETVRDAVELAYTRMSPGDELLFSPAAASFDAYPNFKARAMDFRAALRARPLSSPKER